MNINNILEKLELKTNLEKEDLETIYYVFSKNIIVDEEINKLVLLWKEKGETAFELKVLADLLYQQSPLINLISTSNLQPPAPIIDICGTGGDKSNTFNISTLAAIVASASGANVIKHSGRSTTSISGSVDILSEFGVIIDAPEKIKQDCFLKTRLMFVSSQILRETFGKVKMVCKQLNIPGFANLLGPLTNPYKISAQLIGVSRIEWGRLMIDTLKFQEKNNALVVCSITENGMVLDELSFCGKNFLWSLNDGKIKEEFFLPNEFNEDETALKSIVVQNHKENKIVFEEILSGFVNDNNIQKIKTVALNAGAVLYLAKKVKSINAGYNLALKNIKSGLIWEHFNNFVNCNKMKA